MLLALVLLSVYCSCAEVRRAKLNAVQQDLIGLKGEDVEVTLITTMLVGQRLLSIKVFQLPGNIELATGSERAFLLQNETLRGIKFETKIDGEKGIYRFGIKSLDYDDGTMYLATAIFHDGYTRYHKDEVRVKVNVLGGPQLCGSTLPEVTMVKRNTTVRFSSVVCGNRPPSMSWMLGCESLKTNVTKGLKPQEYVHHVDLKITTRMCGLLLRYVASGHDGEITGSTKLIEKSIPQKIENFQYALDDACFVLSWSRQYTGYCIVHHEIQYITGKNKTMNIDFVSSNTNTLSYCPPSPDGITKIKVIKIRSKYGERRGEWSSVNITLNAPESSNDYDDLKKGIPVAVALIIALVTVFVVVKKKRKRVQYHRAPETTRLIPKRNAEGSNEMDELTVTIATGQEDQKSDV